MKNFNSKPKVSEDEDMDKSKEVKKVSNKLENLLVETQFHSLYKNDLEAKTFELSLSGSDLDSFKDEGVLAKDVESIPLLAILKPKRVQYQLKIGAFCHQPDESSLNTLIYFLENASEDDELEISINSPGGYIDELSRFYYVIKSHFAGRVTTILSTNGASCGALLFCLGDKRVIREHSYLMFHNYSSGAYGKGNDVITSVNFNDRRIKRFFNDVMIKPGFFTENEYNDLSLGKDFWLDVDDMLTRPNMVTHVIVGSYEIPASMYIEYAKSNLTIDEFLDQEVDETGKVKVKETPKKKTTKKKSDKDPEQTDLLDAQN